MQLSTRYSRARDQPSQLSGVVMRDATKRHSESDREVETAVEEANGDGQEADSEADSKTGQETEDDKD